MSQVELVCGVNISIKYFNNLDNDTDKPKWKVNEVHDMAPDEIIAI